jgi:hypothetical protein
MAFNILPPIKGGGRERKFFVFLKFFFLGIISIFVLFFVILAIYFFNFFSIFQLAKEGKDNLEYSISAAKLKNFSYAAYYAEQGKSDFNLARLRLEKARNNFLTKHLTTWSYQLEGVENILLTAETLSKAVERGSVLGENLQKILPENQGLNFSQLDQEQRKKILKLLYESSPEILGIKADLDLANLSIEKVSPVGILKPFDSKITEIKRQLNQASALADEAVPLAQILPILSGYPQKAAYLVMLQNSDELRPTGGFLGTYGILEVENGEILAFDTHDIYHMDMPAKDKINVLPPDPIVKYLNKKWFLRDANWSPDWPTSAEKIQWFFYLENGYLPEKDRSNGYSGQFNGAIGITPKFITDLLKITGPIAVEGQTYDENNFTKLLEYRVEKGYVQLGISSWQRKEVISEISKQIKNKLFDLSLEKWPELINTISDNISQKNVLVYFNNSQYEKLARELGWAGELKNISGDYLMVVDSNMGAYKTDAVMNKSIIRSLTQKKDGLYAQVKINYAHNGGFDWRTTRYQSYTRIIIPYGSQLIKVSGTAGDSKVAPEELNVQRENFSLSEEKTLTSIGAYVSVEPGDIYSLVVEYKLPDYIYKKYIDSGIYNFYMQKQPGNNIEELSIDVNLENAIKSYSPLGFSAKRPSDNKINWKTNLERDRTFEVSF